MNVLTSFCMFDNFIVCHHVEMKAVTSLDRSPLDFPQTQFLARKQWNSHYITRSVALALPTGFLQAVFRCVEHCHPHIFYYLCTVYGTMN